MGKTAGCMSQKELIHIVENKGWFEVVGGNGSHRYFKHAIKPGKLTIPRKITKNIKLSVLRQAGLRRNQC